MTDSVVTFETSIPDDVYLTLRAQGFFRNQLAEEAQRLLAVRFLQGRVLSLGQAARLAGMDRWAFIDYLSENAIAAIDFGDEELTDEFAATERLVQQIRNTPIQ